MASNRTEGGCFGFIVVSILIAAPVTFVLGHELLAFLVVGIGCFLMLAGAVAVLVIMNNRQVDDRSQGGK